MTDKDDGLRSFKDALEDKGKKMRLPVITSGRKRWEDTVDEEGKKVTAQEVLSNTLTRMNDIVTARGTIEGGLTQEQMDTILTLTEVVSTMAIAIGTEESIRASKMQSEGYERLQKSGQAMEEEAIRNNKETVKGYRADAETEGIITE